MLQKGFVLLEACVWGAYRPLNRCVRQPDRDRGRHYDRGYYDRGYDRGYYGRGYDRGDYYGRGRGRWR